jgi:hypothetical protein
MKPRISEQAIQKALLQHIRTRGVPGLFAFHPANGGFRRRTEAAILSGAGVVAGVPDLILIDQGKVYGLELKAEGCKPTAAQNDTMGAMAQAGVTVGWAAGLDAALAKLEEWKLLRGKACSIR